MSQEEKIFADGFSFKRNDNAPEFVVGRLSIKSDEAGAFLKANSKNGWVNIDIKQAKSGKYYCELDTWVKPNGDAPAQPKQQAAAVSVEEEADDLPF